MHRSLFFVLIAVLILISTASLCYEEESQLYLDEESPLYMKVLALPHDENSVVILVDYQNDFCDEIYGSLYVKGCPAAIKSANELIQYLPKNLPIVTTGDAHKPNDPSFASTYDKVPNYENLWPDHCVKGTPGIKLDKTLNVHNDTLHFPKTQYSVLTEDMKKYIENKNMTHVIIMGVAGEVCVNESIIDLINMNLNVSFHLPGIGFLDNNNQKKYVNDWIILGAEPLNFF